MTTKQVTHSEQSVWDEMKKDRAKDVGFITAQPTFRDMYHKSRSQVAIEFEGVFCAGASFAEKNLKYVPKVKGLLGLVQDYKCHLEIMKRETGFHSSIEIDIEKALKDFE